MNKTIPKTKTALITGANRGIGLAIAKGLSESGNIRVLAAARKAKDADTAVRHIGHGSIAVSIDLSVPEDAAAQAKAIQAEHGPIDILVNNAGILIPGSGLGVSVSDFSQTLTVNAVAPFALINALGPGMKNRGWGRIVNVSSGWGSFEEGMSGPTAYAISKATLNAITLLLPNLLDVLSRLTLHAPAGYGHAWAARRQHIQLRKVRIHPYGWPHCRAAAQPAGSSGTGGLSIGRKAGSFKNKAGLFKTKTSTCIIILTTARINRDKTTIVKPS